MDDSIASLEGKHASIKGAAQQLATEPKVSQELVPFALGSKFFLFFSCCSFSRTETHKFSWIM